MLSNATVIPTAARIAVRNAIVTAPGFDAWRVASTGDTKTRDLTKAQWMEAAHALGVADAVEAIIANPPATPEAEPMSDRPAIDPMAPVPAPVAAPALDADTVSADSVLEPLRPFLAPSLVETVAKALAPIVERANRPPVVQTVERVVYETLAPGAKAPAIPLARAVETSTLGRLFGIRGKNAGMDVAIWNATDAPKPDPLYVPEPELVSDFVGSLNDGDFVWLAGPAGSGKTTLPRQVASVTYRPFVRIAFNRATEPTDLIGMFKLDGAGGMVWADGVLTQAIRRPGTIILLDEPTFAPPGIAASLQTLLDERRMTIAATGEVIECAKGVYFCAADNTRGYGDETGRYAGTMQANSALIDRFASMLVVDYMDPAKEAQALANHAIAPRAACDAVVAFVGLARKLPGFGDVPLSLRRMVAFVRACKRGTNVTRAFENTFLTRLPDGEREALRQAFRAQFNVQGFDADLNGKPAPAAPSSDPAQAQARAAFEPLENL